MANAMNAMSAMRGNAAMAPPPAAASMMPPAGPGMRAPAGGTSSLSRVSPELLEGLPPEFIALLSEIGQLIDLDGDGTPDVAVVPLNAMAAGRTSPAF